MNSGGGIGRNDEGRKEREKTTYRRGGAITHIHLLAQAAQLNDQILSSLRLVDLRVSGDVQPLPEILPSKMRHQHLMPFETRPQ